MEKQDKTSPKQQITFIGHPFAPIGRGEDVRCAARAAKRVGLSFSIVDLDQEGHIADLALEEEFAPFLTDDLSPLANIFFINGDEVDRVRDTFPRIRESGAVQIIVPQWELANYPAEWAEQIEFFDEIWAPSRFVEKSLTEAVSIPVKYIPLPVEVVLNSFLPRRYYDLPESSFLFLFFFDYSSYLERKNPLGVIKAFELVCDQLGAEDIRLIIKSNAPWESELFQAMEEEITRAIDHSPHRERMILIKQTMTDNQVKNLIRCCDCFLSLHRSEGFGRGLAEAMFLGKPVIGTEYSGNLDFMDKKTAHLVDYTLIPVEPGEYPHGEGQVWADPDLDEGVKMMIEIYQNQDSDRQLGRMASRHIRKYFSYRAVGLGYRDRLTQLGYSI